MGLRLTPGARRPPLQRPEPARASRRHSGDTRRSSFKKNHVLVLCRSTAFIRVFSRKLTIDIRLWPEFYPAVITAQLERLCRSHHTSLQQIHMQVFIKNSIHKKTNFFPPSDRKTYFTILKSFGEVNDHVCPEDGITHPRTVDHCRGFCWGSLSLVLSLWLSLCGHYFLAVTLGSPCGSHSGCPFFHKDRRHNVLYIHSIYFQKRSHSQVPGVRTSTGHFGDTVGPTTVSFELALGP